MVAPGFEWSVAWRHLRDPERRSRRTLALGVAVIILALAVLVAAHFVGLGLRGPHSYFRPRREMVAGFLHLGGVVGVIAGAILTFLGLLLANFTLFTAISIFGVFLGTAAPIIALSVMSGFEADLKSKIRGSKADVVVTVADDRPFTDFTAVARKIVALPGVVAVTPFLEGEAMVKSGATPYGILLRGIDPQTAGGVLDLGRTLKEGKVQDLARGAAGERGAGIGSADFPRIILGEELFKSSMRLYVGGEVDVACPLCRMGPDGPGPNIKPFRVVGHFYSGMYEYDMKLAYVDLAEAQRFFGMPGEATGLDIRVNSPEMAQQVTAAISASLGPRYEVQSWEDLNRSLFSALKIEKVAMFIVLTFIALVASFSVVSNLFMLVTEKRREIAILKSMGAANGAIRRIFLAEGLYIALIGMAVGVGTGWLGCDLIARYGLPLPTDVYYISNLPVVRKTSEIVTVGAVALVLSCLATIYPAMIATRLRPVEGLRYE